MREHINKFILFLTISLTVRLLYLFMFHDCHSFDLVAWNQVADILMAGGNPYHLTSFLSWPPSWMQLIFLFKKIAIATNQPLDDVIRGFLILIESALSLLLYAVILRSVAPPKAAKLLIVGIAINPVSIFQVCQHGNFDVLAGLWILLAVCLLMRFQELHEARFWLFACLALGLGALTKVVPLCLAPLLLPGVRKLKLTEQILGLVLFLGPSLLALSVMYVLVPADIETKVLGYRSVPGSFGFTGVFTILGAERWLDAWPRVFEIIYGLGWLSLGAWLFARKSLAPREMVAIASALLLAICAFGPGYGLQYIYWFLPLLILLYALADRPMRILLLAIYVAAGISYTIEYALNFKTYGAFFLDLVQTDRLLKWGLAISSKTGETLVTLPLWLLYLIFVIQIAAQSGRTMVSDFAGLRRRKLKPGDPPNWHG